MASYKEQIKELQDRIASTKYNKKTQHAIGLMKAKLAKLKEREISRSSCGKSSGDEGFHVRKTGDGTVVLLGFPSVGKSTLLNGLTDANSEVGAYAFTTLTVIPGMLKHKHAKIQILDVPGIVRGAASGTGRGKEVLGTIQSADLVMLVIDVNQPERLKFILEEVFDANIRLNKIKPDVKIRKTAKDGIRIGRTVPTPDLDDSTIKAILREFRINNAEVVIRTTIDADDFIDVVEGNKKYIRAFVVLNKIDMVTPEEVKKLIKKWNVDFAMSAHNKEDIEKLKDIIFEKMNLMSIYLKEPTKPADLEEPLIVFKDSTIKDVCSKLHKDFVKKFKFARVWGKSAKFDGQKLMLKHKLQDGDILELHIK